MSIGRSAYFAFLDPDAVPRQIGDPAVDDVDDIARPRST
jgi:hypothetical protein